jgi:UDPglucose 6-dehydrogenase
MGLDSRIGRSFLNAGAGYGGFCFPKDLEAYIRIADKLGYDFQLLKATKQVNDGQRKIVVQKIERELWNLKGKKIAVLGLSFKPDTDDLRFSPALEIIEMLLKAQASVRVYDPESMAGARAILKNTVSYAKNVYDAARDADCLVLMTEWAEFKKLDFKKLHELMKHPVLMDARNLYDPDKIRVAGFRYLGIGRGSESK